VAIFFTLFQHLPLLFRINTNKMRYILVLVSSFMLWTSCSQGPSSEVSTEEQKIKIVCTTSIMTDWVSNVVSSDFEVVPLLKKGIDPHVYKPAKKDLDLLRAADVIIYHGVHLEGKIIEVLEKLEGKVIINAAEDFTAEEIISDPNFPASQDPHYWFDTELVKKSLQTIVREIAEVYPQHNKAMSAKAATYAATIDLAAAEVHEILAPIDSNMRIVITTHDALSYFARNFNIRVNTLQGASTVSEFGLREITELVDFICEYKVPAIFLENIVSPQAMESVQRGCLEKGFEVKLGPELLSDSLGSEEDQDSYTEMLTFNARTIALYLAVN